MNIEDPEEALQKTEQYLCPANRNHKLISLDKLLSHLHTCKEVKLPDKPRFIYYCQYYQGHCFVSEEERKLHEDICKWKNLPGREYDPTANKYSIIQPSGKPAPQIQHQQPQHQTLQQQRNYEYALAKGLIKKKGQEEYIPPNSFEFNKDFKKVDELIKLQIQKNITDQNQSFIQFNLPNLNVSVLSQNKQFVEFIRKRTPYNQHFRNKKYYDDIYKNQILQTLFKKPPAQLKYDLTQKVPNEIIKFKMNFHNYLDYLSFEFDEYVEIKHRDQNQIQTETFIILENTYVIFFIQIGKDFNEVFGENVCEYKAVFSNFISFKFDRDQYLNGQLQSFFNPQIKSEQLNKNKLQDAQNIFEEEIDYQQQKQIGELKAKLEILRQKNQEERAQLKKNQKEVQEIIDKKNSLIQKEINIEQQIKQVNTQINSYNAKIKQFQTELENKNQEKIKLIYEQKEKELNLFIEDLNKQIILNQDNQQQITEEVQELQEEKQKLKNNVNRLQLAQQQLERQVIELKKQESSVPQQMNQSEYYSGTEFIFDISDKIKCQACKQRKINVVYLPCGDAVLCKICHERFEQVLPHICPICEKTVKRIYHFMWENEK